MPVFFLSINFHCNLKREKKGELEPGYNPCHFFLNDIVLKRKEICVTLKTVCSDIIFCALQIHKLYAHLVERQIHTHTRTQKEKLLNNISVQHSNVYKISTVTICNCSNR